MILSRCKAIAGMALLATLTAPTPAIGADKILEPVTPWHVEWTKDSCVLSRGFGSEDNLSALRFEKFAPGPNFQLILISDKLPVDRLKNLQDGRVFSAKEDEILFDQDLHYALFGERKVGGPWSLFVPFPNYVPKSEEDIIPAVKLAEMETEITRIGMRNLATTLIFNTGKMEKPLKAIDACMRNLVRTWGLDPDQQAALSRPLKPIDDPARWVVPEDYPRIALRDIVQAIVNFRLMVDENGTPTSYTIQNSYSEELFRDVACKVLMERAKFEPALDQSGKPIPSVFGSAIRWIIP